MDSDGLMVLLSKALVAQFDGGRTLADRKLLRHVGDFEVEFTLSAIVKGHVSEATKSQRWVGVEMCDLLDVALSMMGATADNLRKFGQVAAELKRAEMQGRPPLDIKWTDGDGNTHTITGKELETLQQRIKDRKLSVQMQEQRERFSRLMMEEVPVDGPVNIREVHVAFRPGTVDQPLLAMERKCDRKKPPAAKGKRRKRRARAK